MKPDTIAQSTLKARLKELQKELRSYKQQIGSDMSFMFEQSEVVSPNLLVGSTIVSSRYDLIKLLPSGGKWAEVGTFRGDFA